MVLLLGHEYSSSRNKVIMILFVVLFLIIHSYAVVPSSIVRRERLLEYRFDDLTYISLR